MIVSGLSALHYYYHKIIRHETFERTETDISVTRRGHLPRTQGVAPGLGLGVAENFVNNECL